MNKTYISTVLCSLIFATFSVHGADNSHSKMIHWQASDGSLLAGPVIRGSSAKLTRGDGLVWLRINTTGLPAGAYTLWWVIFNNPDACGADGCTGGDFGNPAVAASALFATGGVVLENGIGHFRAHLEENDPPGQVLFGPGLVTASGAEIHIIVRYHGPAGTGDLLTAQTTTFGGGCMGMDPIYPIFPCYDPQATALPRP